MPPVAPTLALTCALLALAPAAPASSEPAKASEAALAAGAEANAAFADADAALRTLEARMSNRADPTTTTEERALARRLFEEAAAAAPAARWDRGLGLVIGQEGDWKAARKRFEAALERDPEDPENHYWYGNATFNAIGEMGTFEQMSAAGKGRKAYESAIRLDPSHVGARFGMAMFYAQAPGIAGGDKKKARALADEMIALEQGRFLGQQMRGIVAAGDSDWATMTAAYDAAYEAAEHDFQRRNVLRAHASSLLRRKQDPAAALPLIERYAAIALPTDAGPDALTGDARAALKEYPAAIDAYRRAIGKAPKAAPSSQFGLASALQASGKTAEALAEFETFLATYPKDRRADDAKKQVRALKKAAGRK